MYSNIDVRKHGMYCLSIPLSGYEEYIGVSVRRGECSDAESDNAEVTSQAVAASFTLHA